MAAANDAGIPQVLVLEDESGLPQLQSIPYELANRNLQQDSAVHQGEMKPMQRTNISSGPPLEPMCRGWQAAPLLGICES
jgi:hypothetical protein